MSKPYTVAQYQHKKSMPDRIILTSEGIEKLAKELEFLKKERRPQIAERIQTAKEFGDLSENAEYHEAKEEQGFIEGRILQIEHLLKIAEVADKKSGTMTVMIGSEVTVDRGGTSLLFHIVGATEADPLAGKISLDSPLGQALIGKSIGESVTITTPSGLIEYTIKSIS